jgi:carbonic anhydrase/acetyltransferase-like protein (isoleucine patch superfamily)
MFKLRSLLSILIFTFAALGKVCGAPNVTVDAVDPPDRLSGSAVLGEWTVDGDLQSWTGTNAAGLTALGGVMSADSNSASADATVELPAIGGGPDLDLGYNDYLQIRIKLPSGYTGDVMIKYGTTINPGFSATRQFVLPAASVIRDGAFHTYRLDLGLEVFWRDTLRDIRITPLIGSTGHFEIDYVEVGDVAGTAPSLNVDTNFLAPLTATNTNRMESKHFCVWWDPANAAFTTAHARRALRMGEECYQVYCKKLGYNEPFRAFDSTTTPLYKLNVVTWYSGYWAGGYANRPHLNIGAGGLGDEGWGSPMPHEFGHCLQMAQPGRLVGGHWESHANYLRAERNLHFFDAIPGAVVGIDDLTSYSNYRPDHQRLIYADQRYYLPLDDYGTQFGLPANYAATAWRDGLKDKTLIEKLAGSLPVGTSVKDVACESCKHWPMLDFVEKTRLRAQHWSTPAARAAFFWKQGARLIPQQDKPGWWRVPLERAPDAWGYQIHELTATAGATITAEVRGLDLPGTGEGWRWCFAAISAGDVVRYSPVFPPGTQNFTLAANETQVYLIVTATPDATALDLDSYSNTKSPDKHADRLRYAYEVRLVNVVPSAHRYEVGNPSGFHTHGNGGGIVGPSATVAATAYVGPNAKVLESAKVLGSARVEDYAVVRGTATVQGSAVVSGATLVEGNAVIEGEARVRERAWLRSGAQVRGRALITGYTTVEKATVQDDAVVRGCASPWGGTISGTAIMDHDYSMAWTVSNGTHFSHIPWGGWWDAFYAQTLRKPRGLIASYRTEEANGEEWWDEFGALHAHLRGSPVRTMDATLGSTVMTFNGVSAYAALDRSLADTSRFTFSCWVNPSLASGTAEPLLFLGSSSSQSLKLVRDAMGRVVLTISNGSTTSTLTSTSVLAANAWRHIAVTLDGSNGKLFVSGNVEDSKAITLTPLNVSASNDGVAPQANYLGRNWDGSLFKGSFDDVRFYNVTLSTSEIHEEAARRGDMLGQFSPGTATDFNGSTTTAESGVRNGRVRTLSAWVKPRTSGDVTNYEAVFDSYDERLASNKGSGIGLDAGKWVARLDGVGKWATTISATVGVWQHVALTFDGTTAKLFINGVLTKTRTYTGPATNSAAAGKCYRIGYSQTSEDTATRQFFDGLILNARVYDRALTAAQITTSLDSDGDGMNDNVEADAGTDPLTPPTTRSIAGIVTDTQGAGVAGATVYFSDVPGAADNALFTATTDGSGNYSHGVASGTWYVSTSGVGYNATAEQNIVVTNTDATGINFSLAAYSSVSGRVTGQGNGLNGAVVYLFRTAEAVSAPTFTVVPDANGFYTQVLPDGLWFVSVSGPSWDSFDVKTVALAGSDVGNVDFAIPAGVAELVARYKFDETSGTSASDSSGHDKTGILSGPATWIAGKYNSAVDLDGANPGGYVSLPNGLLSSLTDFTISTWVNLDSTANWSRIFDFGSGTASHLFLCLRGSAGIRYAIKNGGAEQTCDSLTPFVLGVWKHVAVTQSGNTLTIYIDGVQVAQNAAITLKPSNLGATTQTWLGRSQYNDPYLNGRLDDFKIYSRALSAPEVGILANVIPVYTITATTGAGGSISPSGAVTVAAGASQSFTITPNAGFAVSGITVKGVPLPAATSYTFNNVTSNQTISVSFSLTPTALWKQANFGAQANDPAISGDFADPDHDGIVNLIEYATGTPPMGWNAPAYQVALKDGYFEFVYAANKAATDLTCAVEWSDTLASTSWSTIGVGVPTFVGDINSNTQQWKALVPIDSAVPRRFIRLQVTNLLP